jgi:N-acetylglucosamine-6-phosphate deacetylase
VRFADRSAVRRLVLRNAQIVDPEAEGPIPLGWVRIGDDRIEDLGEGDPPRRVDPDAETVDLEGLFLAPGLIDLHFHGELAEAAPGEVPERLEATCRTLARGGTTGFLATTVSQRIERLHEVVKHVCAAPARAGIAACLGIHLEGPWLHPAHAGAHRADAIVAYRTRDALDLLSAAGGRVRMVTLAPEIQGGLQAVSELRREGVVVAIGHSRADPVCLDEAVARGMTHVTHLFNAMTQAHHRDLGVAGCALTDDRLTADLICDGVHVDPRMVGLARRAKPDRLCLITDQVGPRLGGQPLERDGCVWRTPAGHLAGSALSLAQSIACFRTYTGAGVREALATATLRPARVLGLEAELGTLRRGARADLVALDADLRARTTWIGGSEIRRAG